MIRPTKKLHYWDSCVFLAFLKNEKDKINDCISVLTAAEIMTTEVAKIKGSETVAKAVQLMREKNIRTLIVDRRHDEDAYGIITETDIVYKVVAFGQDPQKVRVYEVMSKPCIVINPDLGVEYVARLFANTGIRFAPVIKGGLLGVISVSDILHKGNTVEKPRSLDLEAEIIKARDIAREVKSMPGVYQLSIDKIVDEAKDAGYDEAMHFDADHIRALEVGLAPTGGLGIGIEFI